MFSILTPGTNNTPAQYKKIIKMLDFKLYYTTVSVSTFVLFIRERVPHDPKRYRMTCIVEHIVCTVCVSLIMPMLLPIVLCAWLCHKNKKA
jgi:hypothetical protein